MKRYLLVSWVFVFLTLLLVSCETPSSTPEVELLDVDLSISTTSTSYYVGDTIIVDVEISEKDCFNNVILTATNDAVNDTGYNVIKNVIVPTSVGTITIEASIEGYDYVKSNQITLEILPTIYDKDPYENINKDEFYLNYVEAINEEDAKYRTEHGLMSGDIKLPNEAPKLASYQPTKDNKYLRNTNTYYSDDLDTYYITDAYGEIVDVIFEGAGYMSLDEVAAHLLAFGATPGNYMDSKKGNPTASIWKEYLRLNNSSFSGSTTKYPYEPELPNISGCGGDLYYYEIDFGTSGTTCDPNYAADVYNNGTKITRGAARLVYTRYDKDRNNIIDPNEKYVFYTYNHYNDFQEYLNYQDGWGEIFGNITGGGTISSKYDYNPTPYVEVERVDFSKKIDIETKEELFVLKAPLVCLEGIRRKENIEHL